MKISLTQQEALEIIKSDARSQQILWSIKEQITDIKIIVSNAIQGGEK